MKKIEKALLLFIALSVSLPIAWISLGKVLILLFGIVSILMTYSATSKIKKTLPYPISGTSKTILAIVIIFGISLLYTQAELSFAVTALLKHCKILIIPLLIYLIKNQRTAVTTISTFLAGQCMLISLSWLLYFGVELPWDADTPGNNVVFSSYLDQSIMFAVDAAILWHLRTISALSRQLSIFFALAAIINIFLLLEGRTGYVVALAVLGLAAMWAVPKRLRLFTLVTTPILLLCLLFFSSSHIQNRVAQVLKGSQGFSLNREQITSEGWRLNAWIRSIQAISFEPLTGYGVGSWSYAVKKMEGEQGNLVFGKSNTSNPHQEYLLWGVELGIIGIALFLTLLICATLEGLKYQATISRAQLSVLTVISIACLFNSSLYDDLIGDYLCVALGLTMALGKTSNNQYQNQNKIKQMYEN